VAKNFSGRAWLDEDGRHIWFAHDCVDGREFTWLPSTWKADADGRYVTPSIMCSDCGFHEIVLIGEAEQRTKGK